MNHHNILIQAKQEHIFRIRPPVPWHLFWKGASKRFSACASRISFGGYTEIKLLSINVNRWNGNNNNKFNLTLNTYVVEYL